MKTLVVGASGATGKLLVQQLLNEGYAVKVIVRNTAKLPEAWKANKNLEIITASLLELSDEKLKEIVSDCQVIASCLGHNMSLKGIYGEPRKLVTKATQRLCKATKGNTPKRFVLMNTTGNRNRDLDEPISFAQKCVVSLIRVLVPPHRDNETAADFLRTEVGQEMEWVVVRPDSLIDTENVSPYTAHPSPTRSAIFDSGKTSRINVAHFMASLITDEQLWKKWKGQMPVVYDEG